MDWTESMQRAIDYVERHLDGELDYEEIAAQSYFSRYHFHRVFGALCGCTIGEYIRKRRLTLAAQELAQKKAKVLDVAIRYGYDSPDSFSKAFLRFHGVLPSQAKRGAPLRSFPIFTLQNLSNAGGRYEMNYKIEERSGKILVGYKKRFTGVPYGEEREKQEREFFSTTRGKQWLLRGASDNPELDYCLITNVDEEGYDFYIASEVDEWGREALFDPKIMGIDGVENWGFEIIELKPQKYAVFETEKQRKPVSEYMDIRRRIVGEWLPASGYTLKDAPEVVVLHWKYYTDRDKKYIEICLPIE